VRELGRNQEQLKQSVAAIRQQVEQVSQERQKEAGQWQTIHQTLRALQDQLGTVEQRVRAASEESARANVERLRSELTQQREELHGEIRSLNEQLKAAVTQAATGAATSQQQWKRLRADVQRMEQTLGQIERERLNTQTGLSTEVQELREQVADLRGNVMRVQGVLSTMLAQSGRSTVGSAGYTWGW
jgi:chromosome segregation ATPase